MGEFLDYLDNFLNEATEQKYEFPDKLPVASAKSDKPSKIKMKIGPLDVAFLIYKNEYQNIDKIDYKISSEFYYLDKYKSGHYFNPPFFKKKFNTAEEAQDFWSKSKNRLNKYVNDIINKTIPYREGKGPRAGFYPHYRSKVSL
jgi:hypothetical protein